MAATLPVPVSVTPEAADWVAELGIQEAADRILAETVRMLPGLKSLRMIAEPTYDASDHPFWLVLECHGERPEEEVEGAILDWLTWRAENLSMEVGQHFMLNWVNDRAGHAG
jgi:hypothetical protein